jgi:diguanylate cyclase (GGDEF)-like protein
LVVFRDVTFRFEQRDALQKKLVTDPLTGILNRTGFEAALERITQSARQDYAILFMDMNGFKEVNDVHGHEAGDALLKAAATRFSSMLRKQDTLARLGGDEFVVLLEGELSQETLRRLCAKLEASLEAPIDLGSVIVNVGVAVGYGSPAGVHDRPAEVLRRADAAMYARKAEIKETAYSLTAEL